MLYTPSEAHKIGLIRDMRSFWGCMEWVDPSSARMHQDTTCAKRQIPCELGCGLILRQEQWHDVRHRHSTLECPKRLVPCTRLCGQSVIFDQMDEHLTNTCPKRPAPPVPCRLGCPWKLTGALGDYKSMLDERKAHEKETCPNRIVKCDWPGCMAEMKAKDRADHRKRHLHTLGITTWTTAGTYADSATQVLSHTSPNVGWRRGRWYANKEARW